MVEIKKKINKKKTRKKILGSGKKRKSAETRKIFMSGYAVKVALLRCLIRLIISFMTIPMLESFIILFFYAIICFLEMGDVVNKMQRHNICRLPRKCGRCVIQWRSQDFRIFRRGGGGGQSEGGREVTKWGEGVWRFLKNCVSKWHFFCTLNV